ncbi:hypothetical protein IWW36_001837 [Coemansia brasiliensis]|uniref:WAC domain-containing protein n=1 Tax=Coemansia brasiliensis TaxID=2650707 RepID=A0A9W8ID64_9FUNG|nr:hypothetical protein IWW36_001837 [Coemansia brasiliensis]
MPLLNGQAVEHIPPPANVDNNRTVGWEIRFTGEKFDDYDKYIERLLLYRKPIWSSNQPGRSCLTYEQALLEERAQKHMATGIGFSDMLVCAMVTFLSQSTLPISQAVDALFYRFQYDFFIGEHIDVRYPDAEGAMYECTVVGVGPLPAKSAVGGFESEDVGLEVSPTSSVGANVAIERLGEDAHNIIAFEQRKHRLFTVCLFDMDGKPIEGSEISVPATELGRSRNVFTKVALRQFLDEHMRRDPRPNSPWIIRPEWRERFHIPFMFSGEARLLRKSKSHRRESDMLHADTSMSDSISRSGSGRRKTQMTVDPYAVERNLDVKFVRKYPADDLEYLQFQHVKMGESMLWALRRKTSAAGTREKAAFDGSKNRQITDFFSISEDKQAADEEAKQAEKEEEEESVLQNRWPIPLCKWQVPQDLVSRTLATYMFVSFFSSPLQLQPFSLDFFESALVYNPPSLSKDDVDEEAPAVSSVYSEMVLALLNSLIADRKQHPVPANVTNRIKLMKTVQDANASDFEKPVSSQNNEDGHSANAVAKSENGNAMEVDHKKDAAAESKNGLPNGLPPAGPLATGRRSRSHKNRTSDSALIFNGTRTAPARTTRSGRSRLQRASLLSTSSSIASSDSESGNDSEESSATAGSGCKGSKRALAAKQRRQKGRGSRANTPVATDTEEELVELSGRKLLRHLSRSWATAEGTFDEWALKLAGWICEARHDYAELDAVYGALWKEQDVTSSQIAQVMWTAMTVEQRLAILELLVGECANNEAIRRFLEQSAETATDLRRERIELRREVKRVGEAMAELDKADAAGEAESRVSREQGRREKEEEAKRQKERRKLGESERQMLRRLDYVERELRRNMVGRLAPLGSDRFRNRYYFIDGIGGCPLTGGSGRILVQPAPAAERERILKSLPGFVTSEWALQMPPLWAGALAPQEIDRPLLDLAFPNEQLRNPDAESLKLNTSGELWGYFATTGQIDELKRWLDPRGRREAALLAELDLLHMAISASLRKRCQALEGSVAARLRTREHLCDRISARINATVPGDAEDPELALLHRELAQLDATHVPEALLPPASAVETYQVGGNAGSADHDPTAVTTPVANSSSNGTTTQPPDSRASSIEPPSSAELSSALHTVSKRVGASRPARGRRPKNRSRKFKTYMDEFIEYENTLRL